MPKEKEYEIVVTYRITSTNPHMAYAILKKAKDKNVDIWFRYRVEVRRRRSWDWLRDLWYEFKKQLNWLVAF